MASAAKHRILVVDDETTFIRMVKLNLEGTGRFEVLGEANGLQAARTAQTFKPDLILLDVVMPDADGGDVAKKLREDPLLKDVPIVFLTATVSREDSAQELRRIGEYLYLAKPIPLEELLACIERHLK